MPKPSSPWRKILSGLIVCALFCPPVVAKTTSAERLPLYYPDLPLNERTLDTALFTHLVELLQTQTPVTLVTQAEPVNRLLQRLERAENICALGLIQHPLRDQSSQYVAVLPLIPMQLIVRKEAALALLKQPVRLESLLKQSKLSGALAEQRVYPANIQAVLSKAKTPIIEIGGAATSQRLLAMVEHGRVDFALEYPAALHINYPDPTRQPLMGLSLQENQAWGEMGLYCPRNRWGLAAAQTLDHSVKKLCAQPQRLINLISEAHGPYLQDRERNSLREYFHACQQRPLH